MLAAVNNIAGQAPKPERKTTSEIKHSSDRDANDAEDQKGPPEFAESVHGASLEACEF